jgi:uncharacterized membrane protein required for colicin V production
MAWFDVVALVLIVGIAWAESHRGFGRSVFDLLGAIIALKVADLLSEPLAGAAPLLATPGANQAFWLVTAFVVLGVLTVVGSKFIYETTLMSLDVLDPLVGAILGVASGLVVAHIFMRMLLLSQGGGDAGDVVLNSFMGEELLQLRTYHRVVTALQNLGNW